jgi:hypothetical protein
LTSPLFLTATLLLSRPVPHSASGPRRWIDEESDDQAHRDVESER